MGERNPFRDSESGKYEQGFTPDAALEALRELRGAATTSEIADEVGCVRRTAYNKLVELEESGTITSRNSGRTRLWLLPTDGDRDE